MKRIVRFLAATAMTMVFALPVFAAPAGYTGWSIDGGSPRFFVNGDMVTNSWVKYGNTFYYMGANGYTVPDTVISSTIVGVAPINYVDGDAAKIQYEAGSPAAPAARAAQEAQALVAAQNQAAARAAVAKAQAEAQAAALQQALQQAQAIAAANAQAAQLQAQAAALQAQAAAITVPVVPATVTAEMVNQGKAEANQITDDYQAFRLLHPELVQTYGSDTAGLYGRYMTTYGGGEPGGVYLATIARLYSYYYNSPKYNHHFEDLHNGTHRAYAANGEYIVEQCNESGHNSEHYHKCTKCGHVFKHSRLKDYQ